jgi:hypothetical protein
VQVHDVGHALPAGGGDHNGEQGEDEARQQPHERAGVPLGQQVGHVEARELREQEREHAEAGQKPRRRQQVLAPDHVPSGS